MSTRRERAKLPNVQLKEQMALMEEQAQSANKKKEIERNLNLWKSELFTDMAKLIFAGVILGGVFEKVENPLLLYGAGFSALTVFLYIGYVLLKRALNK
jgi:uncharacterized membrane protein YraQ (UPF0718 family)